MPFNPVVHDIPNRWEKIREYERMLREAEADAANEKYHRDDLRDFEERTYPSPGDAQRREPN